MLKHPRNVSDEQVMVQFRRNAYYQYFCGLESICTAAPCASSELVHFCHRIGEEGVELIFKESIRIMAGDRGYRGQEMSEDTKIMIPDIPKASESACMKTRKHKLFRKRAGIKPVIGHCKSDHRRDGTTTRILSDTLSTSCSQQRFQPQKIHEASLGPYQAVIRRLQTDRGTTSGHRT